MKIGNRRLWMNAAIQALQAQLEVVRREHLSRRFGDNECEITNDQLRELLDRFDEQMKYRPFTEERRVRN